MSKCKSRQHCEREELHFHIADLEAENKTLRDELATGERVTIVWQNGDVCGEEFKGHWQGYDSDNGETVGLYYEDGAPAIMLRISPLLDKEYE